MKIRGITENRVAIVCAIILVLLSVYPAIRQTNAVAKARSWLFGGDQTETVSNDNKEKIDDTTETELIEVVESTEIKTEENIKTTESSEENKDSKVSSELIEKPEETEKTEATETIKNTEVAEEIDEEKVSDPVEVVENTETDTVTKEEETTETVETTETTENVENTEIAETKIENQENSSDSQVEEYSYVAQAGDSYTIVARQSVDKYLTEKGLEANHQQRLVAEVTLTNKAGSPFLEIGDRIVIKKESVAKLFVSEKASGISKTKPENTEATKETSSNTGAVKDYTYVAKFGDSYITIARQAVRENSDDKLNTAQRVAIETKLAEQAKWPAVDINETIVINGSQLSSFITEAQNMNPAQQSAWQVYANKIAW